MDFEEIQLAGYKYRFYTAMPMMRMMQFRSAYRNMAKKIIYASMLEMGEVQSPIGYQMISSIQADSWISATGFEEIDFLRVLCSWMAEPLDFKKDEKDNYLFDDRGNKIPVKSVLDAVIESGTEGIGTLRIFFIGLAMPTLSTGNKPKNLTSSLKKAGQGKKVRSPKA